MERNIKGIHDSKGSVDSSEGKSELLGLHYREVVLEMKRSTDPDKRNVTIAFMGKVEAAINGNYFFT